MLAETDALTIYQWPGELLKQLVRFDTTNPPGNEAACIGYISDLLRAAGIESTLLALDPARPNLIARLRGRGDAPPLLLYGHVDVVTTEHQDWTYPPFAAVEADGFIWGRGTLDMKGGVAMMVAAFLRAHAEALSLPGDVILAVVSDEEASGAMGARYLVEQHAERFAGVRYAIGEFGGFTFYNAGQRFYPVMVAEKQSCAVRATVRGPGGHAAFRAPRGNAIGKLARFLTRLERRRLPVHVTPITRLMVEKLASVSPRYQAVVLRQLLNPALTDGILDLLGAHVETFDPLLHNTVNATIVRGGEKNNVIPSEITIELDGRMLPGFTQEQMLAELRQFAGPDVEFEAIYPPEPGPSDTPDMGLFATLADILREDDPGGIPMPYLLAAVTDARFFARIGIQTYGFLPMRLPKGWNFTQLIHAADERIPVEAVAFGADAIYAVLQRFGQAR
ncbi:MAG: M20/M25/M40 family metallo-hydrolase [Ktedonobacterales bacterium]